MAIRIEDSSWANFLVNLTQAHRQEGFMTTLGLYFTQVAILVGLSVIWVIYQLERRELKS